MPPLGSVYIRLTETPRDVLSVVTASTGLTILARKVPVAERDVGIDSNAQPLLVIELRERAHPTHAGSLPSTTTR